MINNLNAMQAAIKELQTAIGLLEARVADIELAIVSGIAPMEQEDYDIGEVDE